MSVLRRRGWLLHYGSEANHYYAFFHRKPVVDVRSVPSAADPDRLVPLYEADGFVFNACATGIEREFGLTLPIGEMCRFEMSITPETRDA